MLAASVGSVLATELGIGPAAADDRPSEFLSFGDMEPLVSLMQQTPADKLLPILVKQIQGGTDLRQLVTAAALANARTFGGQDYVGFHSFMALAPAWEMSRSLTSREQPLPVLKVLYRNTERMQQTGGKEHEVLHALESPKNSGSPPSGEQLQEATRSADFDAAEQVFARMASAPIGEAYNHLQYSVQDEVDVHRVVLAWRAWVAIDFTGKQHAHTLLRQSVRYCVNSEAQQLARDAAAFKARIGANSHIRQILPRMLDQHQLLSKPVGTRRADDAWIEKLSQTIVAARREDAADAVAAALAEGFSPEDVGEAISLAANALLLRDTEKRVHGDSKGVHASDSANAWRNIARVSNHRNLMASLLVAGYHTAGQGGKLHDRPYPFGDHLAALGTDDPAALLKAAEGAIRENDQVKAAAAIHRYGELGSAPRPAFDLLLKYAISEDGRLHAEKYYHTVAEEFASMRPAFKWRQLTALARVTASSYSYNREDKHGYRAPGYEEARRLLGV
jgi:hypothetical protein